MIRRIEIGILLMAGMVFSIGGRSPLALGQDDWNVPKKAVDARFQNFAFELPDFDQWVLRGRSRDQIDTNFESTLAVQIEAVARVCELSAAQRQKLQMAMEYDVKRFSREIDELKERFQEKGRDQQKYNELINAGSVMQMKLQAGNFGQSPFFQKVLGKTLNREQAARYEKQERERRKFYYEAKIELVMSDLEGSIALSVEQRERLVNLLVEETEPPKKFGQYDYYLVLYQFGKLGEEKLKPILDESQRKSLKTMLTQFGSMESFLKQQGYLQ